MTSTPSSGRLQDPRLRAATVILVGLVILVVIFAIATWLRSDASVDSFLRTYAGRASLPSSAPVGFPVWLEWQHFLNSLLLLLVIRSGWMVRTTRRPKAFWTRSNGSVMRLTGRPVRISLELWLHLCFDLLFVLNGVVFYVLIFVSGQWVRIVPTSWAVFPNAVSTVISYASLHWPMDSGWTNYNALQVLSYFAVVFLISPLAILTGLRMSPAWPSYWTRLNAIFPVDIARRYHFPIMLLLVAFIVVHVVLVFSTGALANLNHMYGHSDDNNWVGFAYFGGSLVITVLAWFLFRPALLRPVASLMGKVSR